MDFQLNKNFLIIKKLKQSCILPNITKKCEKTLAIAMFIKKYLKKRKNSFKKIIIKLFIKVLNKNKENYSKKRNYLIDTIKNQN